MLKILDKAVSDSNQELVMFLLNSNRFISYKFTNGSKKLSNDEIYLKNKKIILNMLNNDMDDVIMFLIENNKIHLDSHQKTFYHLFESSNLYDTFLSFLFENKKNILISKIMYNPAINMKLNKKNILNDILFLSLYYNVQELIYDIFENYLSFIIPEVFIYKVKIVNYISYLTKTDNDSNSFENTSGFELIFNGDLDLIKTKSIEAFIDKLQHCLINKYNDSIFTLLIKKNEIQRLEYVINRLGKKIFNYIPMFILNGYNLSNNNILSNGLELYWACKKNLNNIAWFFISNKMCNINYIDNDGNTCLIFACMNKMESVAIELIYHLNHSTIFHKNNLNLQALDYAKMNSLTKICTLIENINKKLSEIKTEVKLVNPTIVKCTNEQNIFTINPFEQSNLKQNKLIFSMNWIKDINKK